MSNPKPADDFDPFDPVNAAMRAMHQGNMLDAKDAQIVNLKAEVAALRKELAESQENYHLLNEAVAKVLKGEKPTL